MPKAPTYRSIRSRLNRMTKSIALLKRALNKRIKSHKRKAKRKAKRSKKSKALVRI